MDINLKSVSTSLVSEDAARAAMRTLPITNVANVRTGTGSGYGAAVGTPLVWHGYMCVASTSLNVSFYHGNSTSGVLLRTIALAANDAVVFPIGINLPNGLYVNFNSGSGTLVILGV